MPETIKLSDPAPGVAMVTLARPDAANALNTLMGQELLLAWTELAARADPRVAEDRGGGERRRDGGHGRLLFGGRATRPSWGGVQWVRPLYSCRL